MNKLMLKFGPSLVALAVIATSCTEPSTAQGRRDRFEFGALGDAPYHGQKAKFRAVIADMNRRNLAFVVHVGDIQDGDTIKDGKYINEPVEDGLASCSEAIFRDRLALLNLSRHPIVVTPGDNDWTDCANPIGKLELVRQMFFAQPRSHGIRRMPVRRQSDVYVNSPYPENLRWIKNGVVFASVHVVGSNNNLPPPPNLGTEKVRVDEHKARDAANREWLTASFDLARTSRAPALVVIMQAYPCLDALAGEPWHQRILTEYLTSEKDGYLKGTIGGRLCPIDGYEALLGTLAEEALQFTRPILLLHGDSHTFRFDQPLVHPADKGNPGRDRRRIPNVFRLETFGSPFVHWVKVVVDPADPMVFSVQPRCVPSTVGQAGCPPVPRH